MKRVRIHTDGACSGNQSATNTGGWGAVLEYKGTLRELYGGVANTTNNRMELTALIEGLRALKSQDILLEIFSDSAYVINCFQQGWHRKWLINGWLNSKKEPVENRDLWEDLISLIDVFKEISFYSVKGHLDIGKPHEVQKWHKKFNEKNHLNYTLEEFMQVIRMNHLADALANKGVDQVKAAR